jgi:hypothetical protein
MAHLVVNAGCANRSMTESSLNRKKYIYQYISLPRYYTFSPHTTSTLSHLHSPVHPPRSSALLPQWPVQSPSPRPSYPPTLRIAPAHQPVSFKGLFRLSVLPILSRAQFAPISFHTRESSPLPSSNPSPPEINKPKSKNY